MPRHVRRQWSAHKGEVTHVAVGPLGAGGPLHVATGSNDKTVRLWDVGGAAPREAAVLTGPASFVTHVAFAPDGQLLAAAANDNALRLWGLPGERVRHTLTGHLARVTAAAFAPDAPRLYSASHDRTVKLWDLARGYCTRTLFALSACQDLLAAADGQLLASAHHDGAVRLWDARAPQLVRELAALHSKPLTGLAAAGPLALLSAARDHALHVVDLRAMAVRASAQHELFRVGLAWARPAAAPDGSWLACGSHDGGVFVWSGAGQFAACLHAHKAPVAALAWHPARPHQLLSADNNATVVLWDAQP